jgi:hypothetical protein
VAPHGFLSGLNEGQEEIGNSGDDLGELGCLQFSLSQKGVPLDDLRGIFWSDDIPSR